jgi:hypothetical protein
MLPIRKKGFKVTTKMTSRGSWEGEGGGGDKILGSPPLSPLNFSILLL